MNLKSTKFKLFIGIAYLAMLSIGLYFLFSAVDLKDLTSYEFIKSNKNIILKYKNENFVFLGFVFFIFCILWVLLLGFATPLLLFGGFVFGKWWGALIAITSTSIGATLLYLLAGFFFRESIKKRLAPKFSKLRELFIKNDILYFTSFRFIGGTPYAIQNLLPVLFDMPLKNYFIATFIGSLPTMFVVASLGSGVESVLDQNTELSITTILQSPEIYIPLIGFFLIIIIAFIIKKIYFKTYKL